jgi:hypothetical protein
MDDFRLAGEDEFFNPTDLGFVAQPLTPVAPVTPATLPGPGMYEGFTPEALAYVARSGPLENRVGDVRDLLADDFQLYKQLGESGDTWGGKTTTYQAYDPYGTAGEIFDVKESGLKEGLQTFGEMAAPLVLTAGAGTALGNALGLTGSTATSVGNALISGAVTGDPTKALTAGLGSFATPYLSQLGSAASEALGGGMVGDIASRAITGAGTSALGAAVRGGDIGEALLAGGLGGATGAATSGLVKELDLPEPVGRVATTALTSALRGGDVGKAVSNAVIGEILRAGQTGDRPAGASELSKTSFLDPAEILAEPVAPQTDVQTLIEQILSKEEPVSFTPASDYLTQVVQQAPEPQALPEIFAPQTAEPLPPVEELLIESQPFVEDLPKAITPAEREKFLEANIEDPLDILLARPQEEIDWAEVYKAPSVIPGYRDPDGFDVLPTEIIAADQAGLLTQDFGVAPQSDINEVYNRIMDERGGFASTWQTVGSDRVQVQDDGSAIGINTETGETYGLDQEETQRMVDAGLLNTDTSGYGEAIRGAAPPPPAPAPSPAPSPAPAPPAPAPAPAPKPSSFDPDLLMLLGALMTPQERERDTSQTANVAPGVEAGLRAIEQMYGTRRG